MVNLLQMMSTTDRFFLKPCCIKLLVITLLIISGFAVYPETGEGQDIEKRLDFTLPVPDNPIHKHYLGLSRDDRFSLGQIKADIVIIEIFSMYCPVCQREAAHVNAVFSLIQNDPVLKKKIKLIGIGAGNSSFEVDFFREKYTIEFPLFSDTDFSIHKKIGEVRTPHFFGLALKKDNRFSVFYSRAGEVSDPEKFLKTLLTDSGI